ncbi:MAG: bifunctional diaminohydroxyphosphoribosylaminopyrimidine deaminase/5-amino-6-(5-phosphoribosylamino)uracil reductase RibD [Sulfurimonadaceae bacterium]|jgi:diaminohydroxyphosphoribosylaminopyrimidine deaminase/5-amino-6-(5-phosphoribosylamino)uracil reductase|nr:bifunctional diaminohydroxyphosphoribosylaminopyrimidine deaminase/5-amino-6-(5-phosphoribosylamino)uracil reductase RibD [Sulfurimonadaceae bacterium]
MVIDSEFFMRLALEEAWRFQGLTYPNPAVGCTVVGAQNQLLACAAHQKAGMPHAEVLALKDAYFALTKDENILSLTESHLLHTYLLKNHNNIFSTLSLYTTLEPCSHVGKTPSCASLIAALGIKKVYIAQEDTNIIAANGARALEDARVIVEKGILAEEAKALLEPFLLWSQRERFVFFKWAQRLDATVGGGAISAQSSRENVHAMRNRCDLLVIGGNTVRTDRPTLDARLVDGKAPDILIYSREKEFDISIPLFSVEGRKVFIEDNFTKLDNYKNIMIEGGGAMFEATKERVDYHLCYLAPTTSGQDGFFKGKESFEILNIQKDAQDIIMWMKRK